MSRNEAQEACRQEGILTGTSARLAIPSTKALDEELNKLLLEHFETKKTDAERDALKRFWMGGYEESATFGKPDYPVWRWLEGK